MSRLPERLPEALSTRLSAASMSIYNRFGREVDIAIGGIPFLLATNADVPQTIETAKIRKDQFDAEVDPGEQTLAGWWRRSQSSFHEGAGYKYEPNATDKAHNGFWDSEGLDVFTQGELTMLRKMFTLGITGGTIAMSRMRSYAATPTTPASLTAIGNGNLFKSTTDGDPESNLVVLHDPAPTLVDGMISGSSFYSVASDGTLYQGSVSAPGSATTWPCGTTPSRMGWGKHRLWIIGGRKLWQPNLSLAGGSAQNPIFTHPNLGWNYTCMAEGPGAMYFGGHDGFSSSIQAVTFDAGGGIPTLTGATVSAVLPDGELVQEIAVLAGQYIGIGTNLGFRVGVVNSDASITYGPLIVEPTGVTSCSSVTVQGRFFLAAFGTASGYACAYRIDTGTDLGNGVFPYAKDIQCDVFVGSLTSMASIGKRLFVTTSDGRPWYQHASTLVDSAWIQSSRIRYRTTELKNYKFLNVEIEPLKGSLSLDLIPEGGGSLGLGNITRANEVYNEPFAIDFQPMKYVSLKIGFARGAGTTDGPTLNSFLLRALPAVKPQRIYTLPLLCFDKERAKSGQVYGGQGYGRNRLEALQLLEDAAETLVFQEFANTNIGRQVTIESIRFVQTAVASPHRVEGSGGIIILELKTAEGS